MTNSIFATISRFWLDINANAWRYCPDTVQHRLNAAYATLSKELREVFRQQSDADFGRGWREGHEVGRLAGWEQRDIEAQCELAHKNDQIQALMAIVESYEARDESAERGRADVPGATEIHTSSLARLGVMPPRQPVH
jgi:hypothetical protein